jgi:NADH:ubiquinone reductase (non-electrogenic)
MLPLLTLLSSLDFLQMHGTNDSIFAIGDCTATSYAPTAQVASQQGAYLARLFKQMARKDNLQAKLNQLQEGLPGLGGEEKKNVEVEIDGVTKQLEKHKLRPFHYSHQGSLASVSFYGKQW